MCAQDAPPQARRSVCGIDRGRTGSVGTAWSVAALVVIAMAVPTVLGAGGNSDRQKHSEIRVQLERARSELRSVAPLGQSAGRR